MHPRNLRTCYRENIRDIKEAQLILNNLVQKYNYRIVHSTTGEIPYIRFQRAIKEKIQRQAMKKRVGFECIFADSS